MAARSTERFTTITVEGAVLPPDLLKRIAENDKTVEGLSPESYELVGEKLNEAISRSWNRVRALWVGFRDVRGKLSQGDAGTKLTRDKWLLPLLKELQFGLLPAAKPEVIDEKTYAISHCWEHTPIHLVGCGVDLDDRVQATAESPKMSSHGLVQEYLNRSKPHLWAFVSNGLRFRILRDSMALTRQAFVEFDLEAMLKDEVYPDFVLFWLLCHASRVKAERPEDCWLEKWSRAAQAQGTRALDQLRDGVEEAIEMLGRGFLSHSANRELGRQLESGQVSKEDFYRCLLRLVYRLIFLFVAEDRELLFLPAASAEAKTRYRRFYSTARLREMARTIRGTAHGDLWQGLSLVMDCLGRDEGCFELALPALGSFLWSPSALGPLRSCQISNRVLLDAIRELTTTNDQKVRRSIDYRNLGAEELGSIYESLLELHPNLNVREGLFELANASGNERKTTGSYYTPTSLVTCLLDSALDPVLEEAARATNPEKAILDLKVVDPACGSGHFLIAAAHRIAKRLAFIRTGNEEPSPLEVRKALRDVIGHCIYGVDLNEMAVELCKVSLWMEALEPGKPLSFLDSKIQQGNALVGATPALVEKGIPDSAFEVVDGDEKAVVASLRKNNKAERLGQGSLFGDGGVAPSADALTHAALALESLIDETIAGIHQKEKAWRDLRRSPSFRRSESIADAWCAAFVWRKTDTAFALTDGQFRRLASEETSLTKRFPDEIRRLASLFSFFHWHLRFPEAFASRGGFDVVLGNPPWERKKIQDKEFFAVRRPEIANATKAADRKRLIAALADSDPQLLEKYEEAKRAAAAEKHFLLKSGKYPLCGHGDVNTFSVFGELATQLTSPRGATGQIIPLALATSDTTQDFYASMADARRIGSIWAFAEIREFFPATDSREPFALFTFTGPERPVEAAEYAVRLWDVGEIEFKRARFGPVEVRLLNPNTKNLPVPESQRALDIVLGIYSRLPILVHEEEKKNPWQVKFATLFHMSGDSHLFQEATQLAAEGWAAHGNVFRKKGKRFLPLYEAKMVHIYDHRFGTYDGQTQAQANQNILPRTTPEQKSADSFVAMPWFWVPEEEVEKAILTDWKHLWFLGWRDFTRSGDERTVITSFIPRYGVGDNFLLCHSGEEPRLAGACLGTVMSSLIFDFCSRQKVSGSHLKFFSMKQLPVPPPARFAVPQAWTGRQTLTDWVTDRVVELVFTSPEMEPFARDCGYLGKPFTWDEERRAHLRAELDASMFLLFGVSRTDAEYVLDTFEVLAKNEHTKFGEFRTKRLVLDQYDQMTERQKARARPEAKVLPFRKVAPKPGDKYKTCVPLYSLKPAAGDFSDFQESHAEAWVELDHKVPIQKGQFVAQVIGQSMEPLIRDGSFCLFQKPWLSPKSGQVGIFKLNDAFDPESGGRFTVKRLVNNRVQDEMGPRLVGALVPENPAFNPIEIAAEDEEAVKSIARLIQPLGPQVTK